MSAAMDENLANVDWSAVVWAHIYAEREHAQDALRARISAKMQQLARDFEASRELPMDAELGEDLRNLLGEVFTALRHEGVEL